MHLMKCLFCNPTIINIFDRLLQLICCDPTMTGRIKTIVQSSDKEKKEKHKILSHTNKGEEQESTVDSTIAHVTLLLVAYKLLVSSPRHRQSNPWSLMTHQS